MKTIVAASVVTVCALLPAPASAAGAESCADSAQLAQIGREIRAGQHGNIHALVVMQDGARVFEDYFAGPDEKRGIRVGAVRFDAGTLHDVRSISKSVVSALAGVAVARGELRIDTPVLDLLPEYADLRGGARGQITVRHLLTMTSGLSWDETSRPYRDPRNSESAMNRARDPLRYVLTRESAAPPGARWNYSGGDTMLLGSAVERAVGMDLGQFAARELFAPMGIEKFEWLRYDSGRIIAASGLRLTPRDMARFGQLYLDGGRIDGKSLLPVEWVRDSLSPQIAIPPSSSSYRWYGYQWRLGALSGGLQFFAAVGWGGQRIYLVPALRLVSVVTAGLYSQSQQESAVAPLALDRVTSALARCQLSESRSAEIRATISSISTSVMTSGGRTFTTLPRP